MRLTRWIFALLLLPTLLACTETDEIATIFWGRRWKVSRIMLNNKTSLLTADELEVLQESSNSAYVLYFEDGSCSGRLGHDSFSGSWDVDGKKHKIAFSLDDTYIGTLSEAADSLMWEILQSAGSYRADNKYLKIIGEQGYLLFYPLN